MQRGRHRRFRRLALGASIGLALMLVPAGSAHAAIFNLSPDPQAERPDLAVDDTGVSHVAWNLSAGIPGDDALVYCRVPRGGKACDVQHTIALPKTDFDGPQVVLTRSGAVVLASRRCCFPGAPVFAVTSGDGGASFGAPVTIADEFSAGSEWEAALGPGDFSLSLSGGNSGPDFASIWRAAPLDGSDPGSKVSLAAFPKAYFTSTGFTDPTSPIAAYSDLEDIYLRRWVGSGSYNDSANWTSEAYVVHGDEPKLASGLRGVYLIYQGAKPPYQYFVRRFDGENFPGGKNQRVVSDPSTGESAIFRDFLEDGDGNLHAVFRQRSKKGAWGLRHRVSADGGKRWQPVEILAARKAADDLYNLRIGAGTSGGAVVGDHNGEGPVWLAPFGPAAAGGGSCRPTVKIGAAVVRALEGCFTRHGKKWGASGPVKLNGIDIEPLGGGGKASASAVFRVFAIPGNRILTTSAKAKVRVGKVVLDRGPVAWKLPPGNGKVIRLGSPDGSVFRDLGKFARTMFEFPVDGDAELQIAGAGAKVPVYLRMPGLLGGVTGKTFLRTDQTGQVFDGMRIDVPKAAIGLLHLAGVDVTYDGQNRFTGTATIELPPAYSKPVTVSFAFENGELSRLEIDPAIQFLPTPLPIVGVPPTPVVGLDSIGFLYQRKPGSRLFQGNLLLIAGPRLFGFPVVDLDGTVALEFPASKPATLKAGGDLSVVRLPLANAFATYTVGAPGTLEFGGSYRLAIFSGSVSGFVDLAGDSFSASGSASLGPLGGKVVITDKGLGICVADPLGGEHGLGWKWKEASFSEGCPGSSAGAGASAAAASAGTPVKASVKGKGRKRSLRFRMPGAPGRRVTFAEEAKRVYREIGATAKARGSFRFRPAPGPGGKRRIVAILEQDGVPYDKLTVARYKAPPSRRPRRPRRVHLRRRGGKLVLSWAKVRGARGYEVRVSLPRDGRRLLFFPAPKRHALRIRGIERTDVARVRIAAIGADLRTGRAAKAKLKPAKKKKKRRGRGKRRR